MFIFSSFIGFILTTIFVVIISGLLGCIPFFVWIVMVEKAGQGPYMMALTFLIISIIEVIKFIIIIALEGDIKFNDIKSIFKKGKDKNSINNEKNKKVSVFFKSLDIVIVIGCCILAIFLKPHSLVLNLIYDNLIVRMLMILCVPLIIMNIHNFSYNLSDAFWDIIIIVIEFVIIIPIIATSLMLIEAVDGYNYIGDTIESWFVYDNPDYDEIRAEAGFETEYDFLNDNLGNALNKLKEEYDINDDTEYSKIKKYLYSTSDLAQYGYEISDSVSESDDVTIICVVDKKTRNYNIYKINYREYSLTESSYDEMLEVKKSK